MDRQFKLIAASFHEVDGKIIFSGSRHAVQYSLLEPGDFLVNNNTDMSFVITCVNISNEKEFFSMEPLSGDFSNVMVGPEQMYVHRKAIKF